MRVAPPRTTVAISLATAAAYLVVAVFGQDNLAATVAGFVPARASGLSVPGALPVWLTPISATLVHASLLHLGFNLAMLFFCGREDEVAVGAGGVAVLYLVGAYAGAGAQWLADPGSAIPMVGASGAISALVGAYAVLYGQRRPSRLPPEQARWVHVAWLAAAWVLIQLLLGLASATAGVAVAAAAHIGGFIGGILLARPLLRWRYRHA